MYGLAWFVDGLVCLKEQGTAVGDPDTAVECGIGACGLCHQGVGALLKVWNIKGCHGMTCGTGGPAGECGRHSGGVYEHEADALLYRCAFFRGCHGDG